MSRRCAEWLGLPTAAALAGLGLGDRVNLPAIFREGLAQRDEALGSG